MKKKIFIIGIISLITIMVGIICYTNDSIRFKISYEYINLVEYDNGKKIVLHPENPKALVEKLKKINRY